MNDLITLERQYWGYSIEEQKNWLANSIFSDDNHLLFFRGEVLLTCLSVIDTGERIQNPYTEC